MVALGTAALASCGVDQSGLNSMTFLPHDASSSDTAGAAGATGNPGAAGASAPGTAGTGGSAGSVITGTAGDGAAGSAGTAGSGGTAGDAGAAGSGNPGNGGNSNAGSNGQGNGGDGMAGSGGTAGTGDTGGTGGSAGVTGGSGGRGGQGGGGRGGAGGRGGTGGITTPCTPTTCANGCCADATTCIRTRTAQQCGSNGATCAPCGNCLTCSTMGQCQVDTASRWTIVAVSAQLATSNWDRSFGEIGGALPDPFCEYENPAGQVSTNTAGVTDTLIDTLNPTWNQVISPAGMTVSAATLMANNPTWQIWVGDDDGCASPNCLADVACTIRQSITEAQLRAGQLVVNNKQSCTKVTIGFVCQP